MVKHLAILFADLERHGEAWLRVPRERMVGTIGEYRHLAESLAARYGCLYREWAGDGHMFLFETADAAIQFGLRLIDSWRDANVDAGAASPELPLRLGCHFGECTRLEGAEAWVGRANAIAKRVESHAEPNTLYVTANVLDVVDLSLYSVVEVGTRALRGDFVPERMLYRMVAVDERALRVEPEADLGPEDWFLRGVSLIGTDREWSDDEAACYRRAVELRPDYAEAHLNLAVLLGARSDFEGARRHYARALDLRPASPEAHYNYAVFLGRSGDMAAAEAHFRHALRLRPDYAGAHHAFANLLESSGEDETAVAHYEEAIRLRPDDPAAHANYGLVLARLGDVDVAADHYQESLRIRPDDAATRHNFALLLETAGEPSLAEAQYRETLRREPDHADAHNNLAILLQLRGAEDEAEHHYLEALRARPRDPRTHFNYALLLESRGAEAAARLHFRTAHELAPDVPEFAAAASRSA